ncbi:Hypothetical Protein FCC1311_035512 [Hondaea fermentalgiana]|uniref:DUF1664 domain-containing protein n=1 Tax=Hondaea fermentalgiana TaxID=2315210 RepID=A0A2R5GAK8_9STRA|nr:Hypothetical Protein FCC1311_035512 [Hondaea fermentalgiana]|eukprot:GBG27329.1 Hypothetical Protein FCC1311_035512 [Hondaea fermentalgiana]
MSGAAVQISRGALMALSAGAGSLYLYANGPSPLMSAQDIARMAAQMSSANGNGQGAQAASAEQVPAYLKPLADQMAELSTEVARMRIHGQYGHGFAYSQGWGLSWTTIATAGGVGVLFLYMKGYSFADFMYVTKKALAVAVEALEEGIENLGVALEAAKRELSYKLGLLEDKVDETRESLEKKITEEVGDVKKDLGVVGNDVKGISRAQEQVHGLVQSIETQIDSIESRMEGVGDQLNTANRGIYLLCNVVAENMGGAVKGKGGSSNQNSGHPSRGAALYAELVAYTRGAMSNLASTVRGGSSNDGRDDMTVASTGPYLTPGGPAPSSALDVVPSFREMLSANTFRVPSDGALPVEDVQDV